MSTGDRIRARREQLGMTQDELAHKLGYKSRSSVPPHLHQKSVGITGFFA